MGNSGQVGGSGQPAVTILSPWHAGKTNADTETWQPNDPFQFHFRP